MSGSARGTFILNSTKGTNCSTIKVKGLKDVAAAREFVTVDKALMSEIAMNPSMYYFNVHTKAYSSGAVRGQLGKKK